MANWCKKTWFGKPALKANVLNEDGKQVNKEFKTTSKKLIRSLKPILQNADSKGKQTAAVSILKLGKGLNANYTTTELPPSFKDLFSR